MPTITVSVDDALKARMEEHPEINWSEVTRQAIREKIATLELGENLTTTSELTAEDVERIAAEIDEVARKQLEEAAE